MSAKAMTIDLVTALHVFNSQTRIKALGMLARNYKKIEEYPWGGGQLRFMMQTIYMLAFLCLLHFDEVLKIQAHHITVVNEAQGHIKLYLPFRKTHQYGGECSDRL